MLPLRIVQALAGGQVRCCLVGAQALALRGVARYTADVDLLTMNAQVLDASFWPADLAPEVHRGDEGDPLGGVARFEAPSVVDVIVGRGPVMREAVETATTVDGVPVPVVTARSLALLKLEAGGVQDLADVELLIEARRRVGDDLRARIAAAASTLSEWGQAKHAELERRLASA